MAATKKSRFDQLEVVKAPAPVEEAEVKVEAPAEAKTQLETLSSQMRRDLKIALKQASAREERKQYQLIEEAVTAYLKQKHPQLLE